MRVNVNGPFPVPRRINGLEFEKEGWGLNGTSSTKTLFKEGAWEIHENPLRIDTLNPALSRVVHYCEGDPRMEGHPNRDSCQLWDTLRGNLECPVCNELMPDSIQTLWTLQNFDIEFGSARMATRNPCPHPVTK
jgi:hypothetical protein